MPAHKIRILPPPIPEEDMRRYYEKALAKAPDVWDVSRVCAYTGYNRRAVLRTLIPRKARHAVSCDT